MAKFKPQHRRLLYVDEKIREGTRTGQLANCRSLAEGWEVSPKTIMRDIEHLRDMLDAPIDYDQERHGYYYTQPDFLLPALRIGEQDLFAICLAQKVLQQYENTPLRDDLRRVFDKIQAHLPDNISIQPSLLDQRCTFFPDPTPHIDPAIWEESFKALRLGHTLDITYQLPGRPAPYDNRVDPYHAIGYRGDWYLLGRCHHKSAIRMFSISRIRSAKTSSDPFQLPTDFDFETLWKNHFGVMLSDHEHEVRVRFRADQAPYVREREWSACQTFHAGPDGSLEMSFRARHLFEVTRWILSWGSAATVLAPEELVESVKAELRGAAEGYGKQ